MENLFEGKIVINKEGIITFYSEQKGVAQLIAKFLDKKFEEQFDLGKESVVKNIIKSIEMLAK